MIPDIDLQIGISIYSTKIDGIGGKIKAKAGDFIVQEIISQKSLDSIKDTDGYAVYKLKKQGIDTSHALADLFKKKGARLKALGLKDSLAATEQFVISQAKNRVIEDFHTTKYSIQKIGFTQKPLSKKNMIGNHFKIKITESLGESRFTEYDKILNFYGYQRFGSQRPVTHLIGKAILQRDFKKAVQLILSFTSIYDAAENTEIREKLADESNYLQYKSMIPPQMDIERIVIDEMLKHGIHIKAIHAIPLQLRRFYIQAYQSFIFNQSLSLAYADGEDLFAVMDGDICFDKKGIITKYVKGMDASLALPFVGYSYYKKTRFDYQISKILKDESILPKDFFIKEMQEVSNEGGFRQAAIQCWDYTLNDDIVEFSLSRGSFATILLREIIKPNDPIAAGF